MIAAESILKQVGRPGFECPEDYREFIHSTRKKAVLVPPLDMATAYDCGHLGKFSTYSSVLNGKGSKVTAERGNRYDSIGDIMKRR